MQTIVHCTQRLSVYFVKQLDQMNILIANFDFLKHILIMRYSKHQSWKHQPGLYSSWGFFLHHQVADICSVQFSHSVMSDSLWPHESQHSRPPCPSPTPGVHSNSCLSSRWCHPAISLSVVPFYSCPQSLPASGSFPVSQLFAWGGQSIGVSASKQSFQWTPRTDLL